MPGLEQSTRDVFVIMPFEKTPSRNSAQLTTFFTNNIKAAIEGVTLKHKYVVHRSGETFDITTQIIRDLYRADVVIADLSGFEPNPNVMYELGVRLAISHAPVVLIREQGRENKRIFDILGFYTHDYDPLDYGALEKHLVDKLARLESGEEPYTNPVMGIIREEMARLNPDLTSVAPERQRELALLGIRALAGHVERAYGPNGDGLAVVTPDRGVLLETRGVSIALAMHSANPFEDAGIRAMAGCANRMAELGDGTKLAIILTRALIEGCIEAQRRGLRFRDLQPHLASAITVATDQIRGLVSQADARRLRAVANTAAKRPMDVDVVVAVEKAGSRGIVSFEEGGIGEASMVEEIDHPVFDRGAVHPTFVGAVLDDCKVFVCLAKLSSIGDVQRILELALKTARPLLVVATDIEGEALATIRVNWERGAIRCAAIKGPGRSGDASGLLGDLAILTGATIVDPTVGPRLEDVRDAHLGQANKVVVRADSTEIIGGRGDQTAIAARVGALERAAEQAVEYERWVLAERVARLAGSIVTVRVGGDSADDIRDKVYRARTARSACAAAIATGCVPGGGVVLLSGSSGLEVLESGDDVRKAAIDIVRHALETPFHILVPPERDADEIAAWARARGPQYGYNATTRAVEDLEAVGILDPLGVVVQAVEVAHAAAAAFFATGAWHVQG